jgi:Ca2+-binding RTX toxin-like protein
MTIYNTDALYGGSVAFDPNTDVLNFDKGEVAGDVFPVQSGPDTGIVWVLNDAVFQGSFLLTGVDVRALDSDNFVFSDGGQVLIGDNTHGVANDDAANVLTSSGVGSSLLMGLGGDDTLTGTGKFDTLIGGDGNDVMSGGKLLVGGNGDDTMTASAASSHFYSLMEGGLGHNVLNGNGNPLAYADYDIEAAGVTVNLNLQGVEQNTKGAGFDTLNGVHNVLGSFHNDTLIGDNAGDALMGNPGDDTIIAGAGNDILDGGDGADLVAYINASSGVTVDLSQQGYSSPQNTGGSGTDTLVNFELLLGSNFNDTLTGAATSPVGYTVLLGAQGDDLLRAAASATIVTILNGGPGNDTIDANGTTGFAIAAYGDATSGVNVNLSLDGVAQNTGGAGVDTLKGIHAVSGSTFNDMLTGSALNDVFYADIDAPSGASGDDTINGGAGEDGVSFVFGSAGISASLAIGGPQHIGNGFETLSNIEDLYGSNFGDLLTGNGGANLLSGGLGDDTLDGAQGNDVLDGGAGNDTATYADAASAVTASLAAGTATGGAGSDTLTSIENLTGSNFNDTLTGDGGDNILKGGNGADSLYGGSGDDKLDGGAGNDLLDGGSGVNTAVYNDAGSHVTVSLSIAGAQATGGAGTDTLNNIQNLVGSAFDDTLTGDGNANVLTGNAGADVLQGMGGDDTLLGSAGDDSLYGGAGNDSLAGGAGKDSLDGGAGDDTLLGGAGGDTLTGGAGADHFLFTSKGDSTVAKPGQDLITDFSHAEGDKIDLSADPDLTFVGSFTHHANQLIEVAKPGGFLIEVDGNGDAKADFAVFVAGSTPLVAGDFIL